MKHEPGANVITWTPNGYAAGIVVTVAPSGYWISSPDYGLGEVFYREAAQTLPHVSVDLAVATMIEDLEAAETVADAFGEDANG